MKGGRGATRIVLATDKEEMTNDEIQMTKE